MYIEMDYGYLAKKERKKDPKEPKDLPAGGGVRVQACATQS
jgi:hypothetical protein